MNVEEYRTSLGFPLENLAISLWGVTGGPVGLQDYELVEVAARKIETLKKLVLGSGFSKEMLKIILEDI